MAVLRESWQFEHINKFRDVERGCGQRQSRAVTFRESSYSSNNDMIGQAMQRLLTLTGTVGSWTVSADTNASQKKANLTTEQATKAIAKVNGFKLPLLGGSKMFI